MYYNTYVLMFIAQIISPNRFIKQHLKVCNAEDAKLVLIFNLSEGISLSLLACLCFSLCCLLPLLFVRFELDIAFAHCTPLGVGEGE